MCSIASDGYDNTLLAGALCDMITVKKAEEKSLVIDSFLTAHNSYAFSKQVEDYLDTGPTGSNVFDLVVVRNRFNK